MAEGESHPAPRRPPDAKAVALVLLLCLIWGFQQVAMKRLSAETPSVMQLTVRFAKVGVRPQDYGVRDSP